MQASWLTEFIPFICTSALWNQFLFPCSPYGVADGCFLHSPSSSAIILGNGEICWIRDLHHCANICTQVAFTGQPNFFKIIFILIIWLCWVLIMRVGTLISLVPLRDLLFVAYGHLVTEHGI